MNNKFVIVGGGSTYTPGIVQVLRERTKDLKLNEIVLYDIDKNRLDQMGEFVKIYIKEYAPNTIVKYTTDIEEALQNANFIFVQIRPGLNKQRELDEKICLKHGLVGQETCGLGGFAFAMRNIPAILKIVKKTQEICPTAWILNYSNPEAIISEAVYRTYPNAKMLCICDMPIAQELSIAKYLNKNYRDLTFKYFGLNHFGWFTNIYDETGEDLLPKIKEKVLSGEITSFSPEGESSSNDNYWIKTFQNVIKGYKMYSEYLPLCYLQYYYFPDEMIESEDINYTRANYVMDNREKRVYSECKKAIELGTTKGSPLVSGVHSNYIVDIASSIINNKRERFVINVMNNGIIGNFNHDAVVEVPCYVGSMGIEPIAIGCIPQFYKSLMELQKGYEKLTVEAAITGSYEKAMQAILLNKTVPSYRVGKIVLDEMIEANKDYWVKLK